MTDHKIGTREEWLEARLELLKAEKALTRRIRSVQSSSYTWLQSAEIGVPHELDR